MPQPSVYYACGRIGVLRHRVLGMQQIERLLSAPDYPEACRVLTDCGYMESDNADFQLAADQHIQKACELIERVTPNTDLTDCFLLRYDVLNLKILLKSRFLYQKAEYLTKCGTLDVNMLQHAVTEHRYQKLPEQLSQTMNHLEAELAKHPDPLLIDAELDKAMYRMISEKLKKARLPRVERYFAAKIDCTNFMMAVRLRAMNKASDMFTRLFLPGGNISEQAFVNVYRESDKLAKLLNPYGVKVVAAAKQCVSDTKRLPAMEKAADDYAISLLDDSRYDVDKPEVLISYFMSVQREAADVRLIMTGKLNGFAKEQIEERLRELNG